MSASGETIPTGANMENTRISESFSDPGSKSAIRGTTRIIGNVSGSGDLELDGELAGDISVDGLLVVGEKGSIRGKATAGNMVLAGRVQGKIMVRERIEVRSSGRMEGNVICQKIAIAEGAFMDGEVHTHKGKPLSPEYFTEKRKDLQAGKSPDMNGAPGK
jgi:cytoskeletal protein CcmA (bactofilin family)